MIAVGAMQGGFMGGAGRGCFKCHDPPQYAQTEMNVIRPASRRFLCGFTVISTSRSNAVSIRISFSTETSLN